MSSEAVSAATRAWPASPEKMRHFARRIWASGSLGSSATARSAHTIAASGRSRSNAVSVRRVQARPSSGAEASTSAHKRSAVDTSPLESARRAASIAAAASRYEAVRFNEKPQQRRPDRRPAFCRLHHFLVAYHPPRWNGRGGCTTSQREASDQRSPPSSFPKEKLPQRSPIAGLLVGTYGLSSEVFGLGRLSRVRFDSLGSFQFLSMNFTIEA